jgi:16S rRNA C1402 N4-methylase RsmH
MSGAAAGDPHVRRARVAVDDEVVVGRVFVLTDFSAEERRRNPRSSSAKLRWAERAALGSS